MPRSSRRAIVLTLTAGAAWFVLARTGAVPFDYVTARLTEEPGHPTSLAAHDVYAHFVPIMAYAGGALRAGGQGLWWTSLQNCGQPFAAFHGLLYPLHWLPVVFGADAGLRLLLGANLLLGGLFAYLLGRELGARPTAALTGALAFQLGNVSAQVAAWTPLVLEPLMWFPAVLLCVERLLRAPSAGWSIALGAACCATMLPAWPQLVLLLYQLVALRVSWALAARRPRRLLASLVGIAAGLILGPLLDAVQLLPALDVARESVRRLALSPTEIVSDPPFEFSHFRINLALGRAYGQPFSVIPCLLASLAFLSPGRRSIACFYGLASLLFFALSFGPQTPLFDLYLALPAGSMFREPPRLVWVTGFCLSVLVALGAEVLAGATERRDRRRAWHASLLAAGTLLALYVASDGALRVGELLIGVGGAAVIALTAARSTFRAAPHAIGWLYVASVVLVPVYTAHHLYPSSESLYAHAALFERLRTRTASTARSYLVTNDPLATRFGLMQKSASLFDVPAVADYEPQTRRRFAEFLVMMRAGVPMRTLNAYYYPLRGWMPQGFNRNLLDLAAGRYVVVSRDDDDVATVLSPPPTLIDEDHGARVYENQSALPLGLWVPRVEVVATSRLLLERLAARYFDPWEVALVEVAPPSGFLGEPIGVVSEAAAARAARTTFVRDDPEAITIDVHAPARGFLVLADQWDAGWHAAVNGAATPIVRANYAFRLVEVPAGDSRVELRYTPRAARLGALVSGATLLAVLGVLGVTRRRRGGTPGPVGSTG